MPNKKALALPDALLVRYFRGGEIDHITKVATLKDGRVQVQLRIAASTAPTIGAISAADSASCPIPSDALIFSTPRGRSARVNEDVAAAVAAWLPAWGLPQAPAAGVKDLKGQGIRVAKFTDEETCRFFFPRRTVGFQQRMTKTLTMMLRKRGAKIISVPLTVEDYARWQQAQDAPDSAELRFRFATRPPEF